MSNLTVNFTEEILDVTVPNDSLNVTVVEEVLNVTESADSLDVAIEETALDVTVGSDLEVEITENTLDVTLGEIVEITNNYGGGATYTHTQSTASATWTIAHNMNKNPSVTVIDSGGSYIITDIAYTNSNTLVLTFSAALGGTAYLN